MLDSLVERLLLLLFSPGQVRLDPKLPNLAHSLLLVASQPVFDHLARVFAPLAVLLKLKEAAELDGAKSCYRLTLVCPEGKEFASDV